MDRQALEVGGGEQNVHFAALNQAGDSRNDKAIHAIIASPQGAAIQDASIPLAFWIASRCSQ
jgi:hypothetical protein